MEGLLFLFTLLLILGITVWTIKVDNADLKRPEKETNASGQEVIAAAKPLTPRKGVIVRRPKV